MPQTAKILASESIALYKTIEEEYWGTGRKEVKPRKSPAFSLLDFELIKPFITCPAFIVDGSSSNELKLAAD